jgi:Domain of unknown function (DUF5050)
MRIEGALTLFVGLSLGCSSGPPGVAVDGGPDSPSEGAVVHPHDHDGGADGRHQRDAALQDEGVEAARVESGGEAEPPDAAFDSALEGGGVALAVGLVTPSGIAVDSTDVYFTDYGSGAVLRVSKAGGAVVTLASCEPSPSGIAVDNANVYFTDNTANGSVMKIAKSGGTVVPLAAGRTLPSAIVVDGADVYWTDNNSEGAVLRVPIAGGTVTTLASGQDDPWSIAVTAKDVYWTNYNGYAATGAVVKVPRAGGAVTTLASAQFPVGIGVDSTHVYWAEDVVGTLMSVALSGAGGPVMLASTGGATSLAVDPSGAYLTNGSGGRLISVKLTGGTPVILATSSQPTGIALDATNIYWTDSVAGFVAMIAK